MKDETKQTIKNIFLEALYVTPIDKITVTKICEKASINRGTFYRYYQDVYAVLEDIENSLLSEILDYSKLLMNVKTSGENTLCLFLELLKKNRVIFKSIYANTNYTHFNESLSQIMYEPLVSDFKEQIKPEYLAHLPYIYNYCIAGTIGIISTWIKNDLRESTQEIAIIIRQIVKNGLTYFFKCNE